MCACVCGVCVCACVWCVWCVCMCVVCVVCVCACVWCVGVVCGVCMWCVWCVCVVCVRVCVPAAVRSVSAAAVSPWMTLQMALFTREDSSWGHSSRAQL